MTSPPPIPASVQAAPLVLAPGFCNSLRGIWLLTWRSHCTARGLGASLLALLALPLLAYISGMPISRHATAMGNPEWDFQRFSRNLSRHGMPLTQTQSNALAVIFNEEYSRAQSSLAEPAPGQQPAETTQTRIQQLNDWNRRLLARAESVLETGQFERFQNFQNLARTARVQEATRVRWNAPDAFYHLLVDFYFFMVLPLICVRSCGALIRDELQADTLGFLTTRPAPRALIVVAKYLSQTSWLTVLLLAQTALLFAAGALRAVPGLPAVFGIFLVAQLAAVPAWSALGLLLGLFTKRYFAIALVYGFVVEFGLGRIPSNINSLSLMRHLKALLANSAALRERFEWTDQAVGFPLLALLLATLLFVAASAALFTFREYHHDGEMQK